MTTSLGGSHTGGTATPSTGAPLRPWAVAWLGVLGIAMVNGGVHRAYEPALGVLPAEQLSDLTLVVAVLPWAAWVDHRHPTSSLREAVEVGLVWGALTGTFELAAGHYLVGDSWQTLLGAYDLPAGHLWPAALAAITLAPAAARWWRRR